MAYTINVYSTDQITRKDFEAHVTELPFKAELLTYGGGEVFSLTDGDHFTHFEIYESDGLDSILCEYVTLIDINDVKTEIIMRFVPRNNRSKYIGVALIKELMKTYHCVLDPQDESQLEDEGKDEFNLENIDWLLDYFQRPD